MFRGKQEDTKDAMEQGQSGKEDKEKEKNEEDVRRWHRYPKGPDMMAVWAAEDPDRSTTIYRRFNRLNAYNLLHMEDELAFLEEEVEKVENEITRMVKMFEPDPSTASAALALRRLRKDWQFAKGTAMGNLPETTSHYEEIRSLAIMKVNTVFALRKQMAEYHEALQRSDEILNLTQPGRRTLKEVRRRFGKGSQALMGGSSEKRLQDDQDLCVLSREPKTDPLTHLFEGYLSFLFRSKHGDLVRHRNVDIAVSFISVVLSAAFLLGAVLALFFITNPNAQLGALAGFVGAFALILALLTNARRHEVFAATAAYAAVLVVFIGADIGSRQPTSSATGDVAPVVRVTSTSTIIHLTTATSTIVSAVTQSPTRPSDVPNSASSSAAADQSSDGARTRNIAIGASVGGVTTLVLILILIWFCIRRHKQYKAETESIDVPPYGWPIKDATDARPEPLMVELPTPQGRVSGVA